jgi:hypothetical protein
VGIKVGVQPVYCKRMRKWKLMKRKEKKENQKIAGMKKSKIIIQ